jgi:hypothetical protein
MPVADSNTLPGANPLRSTMWQGDRPFAFAILRLVKFIGSKIEKRVTKPRHKLVRKSYQFLTHVVNRIHRFTQRYPLLIMLLGRNQPELIETT